jgi:hypothetical protein
VRQYGRLLFSARARWTLACNTWKTRVRGPRCRDCRIYAAAPGCGQAPGSLRVLRPMRWSANPTATPKLPFSAAIYSYQTPQSWNATRVTADMVSTKLHGKPAVNASTHVPPMTTLGRARWLETSARYMASWRQWPHPDRSFVKDECARHVFAAESLSMQDAGLTIPWRSRAIYCVC